MFPGGDPRLAAAGRGEHDDGRREGGCGAQIGRPVGNTCQLGLLDGAGGVRNARPEVYQHARGAHVALDGPGR